MATLIRRATADDAARIGAIARAAYAKYVSRIGREPAPMVADFAGHIAADHVVVVEAAGVVDGYMVAWAEIDAYFVHNMTRRGRVEAWAASSCSCRGRGQAPPLAGDPALHQRGNDREF